MSEHEPRFTSLRADYLQEGLVLGGPSRVSVNLNCDGIGYELAVEQGCNRTITVKVGHAVDWNSIQKPLYILERLLMIFDGAFINLEDISFSGSPDGDNGKVEKGQVFAKRLSYFRTGSRFTIHDKLVEYQDVLNDGLMRRWVALLDELSITNQTYLYMLADSGMPADLRLAFLVELAEPMVEIVNKEKGIYPSLHPGERGTNLKQCLNALGNSYGDVIFCREQLNDEYDDVLSTLVNSRVRIMHIKTKMPAGKYFDGKCSVYYMRKMSLLYRSILLDLLGIPLDSYQSKLTRRISAFDAHFQEIKGIG